MKKIKKRAYSIIVAVLLLATNHNTIYSSTFTDNEIAPDKAIISGYVRSGDTGEELIGATIYINELKAGTVANHYGYYSINLNKGHYTVVYSFMGFQSMAKEIQLEDNQVINVELQPLTHTLQEVKITGEAQNSNITRTEMSVSKIDTKTIEKIPALMGEVDVIKAIQLLPGVSSVSEGGSGFSVRGGGIDQNLLILDEANVYNAAHLMGFFSVFNNDAIKDLKIYKGDIPAEYGGRLSSVVDVRMKEGNMKHFSGSGGIGAISGRAMIEGPIWKDRTSFIVAGRRTWADIFLPLASDSMVRKSDLFFYDFNAKINHKINNNNRIFLSGYFGRDIMRQSFADMMFGNKTLTTRWNHLFSQKLFSNLALTLSNYDYYLSSNISENSKMQWTSSMNDIAAKFDLSYFATPAITINYGFNAILHQFKPGNAQFDDHENNISIKVPEKQAIELASYLSSQHNLTDYLTLKYGLRVSGFANYNCNTVYKFDSQYNEIGVEDYSNKFYGTYMHLEPRFGFTYLLSDNISIKGSYSRNAQYLQLAQNSNAGTPIDYWFSASNNIKPQLCDQIGLGYFQNLLGNGLETSVEIFYKNMKNTIDFKDFGNIILNQKMEGELRYGTSYSYGAEFLIKYNIEKFSGWVSYTYSRALRTITDVNKGKQFVAPFDKPHDIALVGNYEINSRLSFSTNWVFSSGLPVTYPAGKIIIGQQVIPIYTGRNENRMPAYHRLDMSLSLKSKQKENRKWHGEWNFSIYNVYGRKNAWAINFVSDKNNPGHTKAVMTYLFPIVPSISYNLKF